MLRKGKKYLKKYVCKNHQSILCISAEKYFSFRSFQGGSSVVVLLCASVPSRHITLIQRRLNVDATSWRCIDVEPTLYNVMCLVGGYMYGVCLPVIVLILPWVGASGGLCFVIVAFPVYRHWYFIKIKLRTMTYLWPIPLFASRWQIDDTFFRVWNIKQIVAWGGHMHELSKSVLWTN